VARVNIETEAFADERFDEIGRALGAPEVYARDLGIGVMAKVWHACTLRAADEGKVEPDDHGNLPDVVLARKRLNMIGRREDFVDILLDSGLGRECHDGIAINGSGKSCRWMAAKKPGSKAGGAATRRKWENLRKIEAEGQQQAEVGPAGLVPAGQQQAYTTPDAVLAPGSLTLALSPALSQKREALSRTHAGPDQEPGPDAPMAQGSSSPVAIAKPIVESKFLAFYRAWKEAFAKRFQVTLPGISPTSNLKYRLELMLDEVGLEDAIGAMELMLDDPKRQDKSRTLDYLLTDLAGYLAALKGNQARASPKKPPWWQDLWLVDHLAEVEADMAAKGQTPPWANDPRRIAKTHDGRGNPLMQLGPRRTG
jgi:hypothetical protein